MKPFTGRTGRNAVSQVTVSSRDRIYLMWLTLKRRAKKSSDPHPPTQPQVHLWGPHTRFVFQWSRR